MTPLEIARTEAQRWTREFYRKRGFDLWTHIGGIVTVLVLEFVFIAIVL